MMGGELMAGEEAVDVKEANGQMRRKGGEAVRAPERKGEDTALPGRSPLDEDEGERGKTTVLPLLPPSTRAVAEAVRQEGCPRHSSSAVMSQGRRCPLEASKAATSSSDAGAAVAALNGGGPVNGH